MCLLLAIVLRVTKFGDRPETSSLRLSYPVTLPSRFLALSLSLFSAGDGGSRGIDRGRDVGRRAHGGR
jgi:hypothetical protein